MTFCMKYVLGITNNVYQCSTFQRAVYISIFIVGKNKNIFLVNITKFNYYCILIVYIIIFNKMVMVESA